jgi:hypothetical protein
MGENILKLISKFSISLMPKAIKTVKGNNSPIPLMNIDANVLKKTLEN